jgi:hypothetical protein
MHALMLCCVACSALNACMQARFCLQALLPEGFVDGNRTDLSALERSILRDEDALEMLECMHECEYLHGREQERNRLWSLWLQGELSLHVTA